MTIVLFIAIIIVLNVIGAVLVVILYRWSKMPRGCDHVFPKNNELNPKCDKCGHRLMELIARERENKN